MKISKQEFIDEVVVVSCGVGTNSIAMLIEMKKRGIIPDHVLFADTGGERVQTYQYIDYFNNWLFQNNMPMIETVYYTTKLGVRLTLEQDMLTNKTIPPIAF